VRTADGTVVHVLASHPTPPAFDGPERRHKLRNHDEIRFWAEYLDGSGEVVDDSGRVGGLAWDRSFVILGDLNADPDEGNAIDDPVGTWLLSHPRVNASFVPTADSMGRVAFPRLDPDDTARWGLRVDYVLPSADLRILDGAVDRPSDPDAPTVSDHFPVWIDVALPADPR
jgi:endonuclease/exonuclease/phosphatase family metal-dependent hydrolase